jgi:hypothetical protein
MKSITAKEFDEIFDDGKDISKYLDLKNVKSFKEFHQNRVDSLVKIEEDLLKYFPDEKSVNDALRGLAKILKNRDKKSA